MKPISNSDELADWLDCDLVESTFRRVPLSEAVYSRHIITNQDREETEGNLSKIVRNLDIRKIGLV
ncbi:MAG: hypothetical protein Ct9H300mP17_07380 [Candidatus Nitrosopelagicus sp.]|nr:MAG: hypothetical protein Ct9H300mP17_07380 [Candidatus Nitrosopelagicus sp.]